MIIRMMKPVQMWIDVDKEHQEITYNIFIKEEPQTGMGEPSVELGGPFTEGVYTFKRTEKSQNPDLNTIWLDYTLGSKNTLQSFVVTMDSPMLGVSCFDITKGEGSQIGFPALPGSSVGTNDPRYNAYRMDLSTIVQHLECLNEQPTEYTFKIDILDDKYQETSITFVIRMMPDVAAYIMEPYCWSTFAVLRGNGGSDESCYFVLTTSDGDIDIDDQEKIVRDANGNMSVLVTGLKVGSYSYKILSANDATIQTQESTFSIFDPTSGIYDVPNLGFEDWTVVSKNKLPDFGLAGFNSKDYLAPNATDDFLKVYWESGNYGASAKDVKLAQSTEDKATQVTGNSYAALLSSNFVGVKGLAGAFSAGSIFIGAPTVVGTNGAELRYGRLHNGMPTQLSGYYKYTQGTIDYINNKEKGGGADKAIIYIALSTKAFDLKSLTKGPTIVRFDANAPEIFAYGKLEVDKTVSEYEQFKIPLVYRKSKTPLYSAFIDKENGTPKIYITIVATSSIDGDAFTGSTGSKLWVDEFSLNYDYDADCFKETEFADMKAKNINDK